MKIIFRSFPGHKGRPGRVGGSVPKGSLDVSKPNPLGSKRDKWPGFDATKTDMPFYDNMLANKDYFEKNKGVKFTIQRMRPDFYLEMVAVQQKTSVSNLYNYVDKKLVKKYAKLMERGAKFPMPVLDMSKYAGQEGRHRAMAAMMASVYGEPITSIPVMVVEDIK